MKKTTEKNMTTGSVMKNIIWFALPILIGNIFQQVYNMVDTAVIGNVLGDDALAAVGAATPLYNLIISFASGFTSGFSVVLAKFYGAGDERQFKKSVTAIFELTLICSAFITGISLIVLMPVLRLLKTPEQIIGGTAEYLGTIILFSVVTMLYNMYAGNLRAIGDSKTPLYFLIISTIVNVVLDIVFVKYMDMGVAGAAYATVIAQLVSVVLCMLYVRSRCKVLTFDAKYIKPQLRLVWELMSMGTSMAMMLVVVSIGSVALQGAVNSLGKATIAAHAAARRIDEALILPLATICTAASTFVGQNYGAGSFERVRKGILSSLKLAMIWSAIAVILVFTLGRGIIAMITGSSDEYIISSALQYLRFDVPFFFVLSVLLVLRSSLQGLERKIVPILGSVVELVFKFAAVGFIASSLGYFGVIILEPIIWCVCAVMVAIDYWIFSMNTLGGDLK